MRTNNIILCAAAVCDITPNGPGAALCMVEDIYLLTGGYIYTLKYERRKKQQTNNHRRIVEIYIYL